MNKLNITRHPGAAKLVKVEKNNWNCFEDCCWDCPCDACTTHGEIQPTTAEVVEQAKRLDGWLKLLFNDNDEEAREDYEADRFDEDRRINI